MIPAILSCFFVAYLYRTLNSEPAQELKVSDSGVAERLLELERRLERLSAAIQNKGGAS